MATTLLDENGTELRLEKINAAAIEIGRSHTYIRGLISRGDLKVYRPGANTIQWVDLNELTALLRPVLVTS